MGKAKQLFITIAGCLALGTVLGVAFWLFDGGRGNLDYKGVLDEIRAIKPEYKYIWKPKQVEIYAGKWHKDYLEVIK